MGNSEAIARVLENLLRSVDDVRRRVGYLETNAETPSDEDLWERLTTYHYGGLAAVTDHFRGSAVSSSWTWAGAPFVVPTVSLARSVLTVSFAAAGRAFLYQGGITSNPKQVSVTLQSWTVDFAAGLRLDDGSDNNYAEVVLRTDVASTPTQWRTQARYRTGGGAVSVVNGASIYVPEFYLVRLSIWGTPWGAWGFRPFLAGPHGGLIWSPSTDLAGLAAAWAPTRVGLIFDNAVGASRTNYALVDWCDVDVT